MSQKLRSLQVPPPTDGSEFIRAILQEPRQQQEHCRNLPVGGSTAPDPTNRTDIFKGYFRNLPKGSLLRDTPTRKLADKATPTPPGILDIFVAPRKALLNANTHEGFSWTGSNTDTSAAAAFRFART